MAQVSRANSYKQSLPPSLGCSRLSVHQIVLLENVEHCGGVARIIRRRMCDLCVCMHKYARQGGGGGSGGMLPQEMFRN